MSFPIEDLPDIPPELIDEVKAFIRIEHDDDDSAIDDFIRSAANLCENFIGQMLIAREVNDMLPARGDWQKLKRLPVQAITSVEEISADGTASPLSSESYAIDIDHDGIGWVRLLQMGSVSRIKVTYGAGLVADWADMPKDLRQGIVRLAGYLYANRDGADADAPPSAVIALWRPHRRMRIG